MKHSLSIALALLVIAALGLGMFAMAEGVVEPETIEGIEGLENEVEIEGEDMGELNLALGDLVSEGPEAPATAVYRFIVNETEYMVQQVREGEAVLRPEDPAAPKGMAFAAWVLEDGTPLFVDADGDGGIDPVIAHVDAQPEVKVWASFAEVGEQPADEQPAEEAPAEEAPAEEAPAEEAPAKEQPAEEAPAGEAPAEEQPAEEVPAEEAPAGEAPAEEQPAEEAPAKEAPAEEQPAEEAPAEEQPTDGTPVANVLTYTGEAQALVVAGEGWLFSMDGEAFTADIPTAVDAGEYTVFYKAAEDAEAQALTVTVAKADVVLIPPEAVNGEA